MSHILSLQVTLLIFYLINLPSGILSFTLITSPSTTPKTLVDTPQTGFTMPINGARTDTREQEAVYEIMLATGNSWATQIPDVCRGRWHGIECMPDKDNIYHVISLSFGALSGDTAFPTCDLNKSYISKSITKLPYLRTLFFYRCLGNNPQPIPSFLGQLGSSLQTLVLRENGHVGPIPNAIGNLTKLRVLDLSGNNLNGSIPLSTGRANGLRSLDLSGNRLMGQIPDFGFPYLNILDLSKNLLSGPIPKSIGLSVSLVKMDLSRNRLSGPIHESIMGLKELILLDLSYNHLTGPFPNTLNGLESLQALLLKGNPMGSIISAQSLMGLNNLVILVLSNMNLQGPIPTSLTKLPKIRVIHIDENKLNGSIPVGFRAMKYLSELRLNDNQLSGPLPLDKNMVRKMGKKLKVYNNIGLCFKYENDGDIEGDSDILKDWGIGYCRIPRSTGQARSIEHILISSNNENVTKFVNKSSRLLFHRFLLFYLLFILFVLWS